MVTSSAEFSKSKLWFNREPSESCYFVEELGNGVGLDMTLVPSGTFLMGSSADEPERRKSEGPQHEVTVPSFFMGTYPITQEQWRVVASFAQVKRPLNPFPSRFKGDRYPVECVSWKEVIEFCQRLSQQTTRIYRLPSEAEWEYACRAKTDTPFNCGTTITTDYANYRGTDSSFSFFGKGTYGPGPTGQYRGHTTPVDNFAASNAFGLFDMHGNVWEWCHDLWHKNYAGTPPTDGSIWEEGGDPSSHVLRGGSWHDTPDDCRSASRSNTRSELRDFNIGFRVVASIPNLRPSNGI